MNSLEFVTSVSALAYSLADTLDDDELALAAATFTQLGDTLATLALLRAKNLFSETP